MLPCLLAFPIHFTMYSIFNICNVCECIYWNIPCMALSKWLLSASHLLFCHWQSRAPGFHGHGCLCSWNRLYKRGSRWFFISATDLRSSTKLNLSANEALTFSAQYVPVGSVSVLLVKQPLPAEVAYWNGEEIA